MPRDWKPMIQEKVIEAAVMTAFNYVPTLLARGFTLVRNCIERVFGTRNEAQSDWVGTIREVTDKAENVLDEYERKQLISRIPIDHPTANRKRRRLGRQRMTTTSTTVEEEESHEFCRGNPRVHGKESRSVSSKRKERGSNNHYSDLFMIIKPTRGLEEDPQRFCTYKYGDDGHFTFFCSSTTTPFKWTYPGSDGHDFAVTFVSRFEGSGTQIWSRVTYEGGTYGVMGGRCKDRCKSIFFIDTLHGPYSLTVDAWLDSSTGRLTLVFSVLPLPLDLDEHNFFGRMMELIERKKDWCWEPQFSLDGLFVM